MQLGNFIAVEGVKIPLTLILDNNFIEADNVFPVKSIAEAEEISTELTGNINIINRTKNTNEPLFLTIVASLPNQNLF